MSANIHLTNVPEVAEADGVANDYFIDAIGNKADASDASAGTASLVALIRYIIANLSTDADVTALLGALDDAAASGAVTDSDTIMAYIKQLVTEGIARDAAVAVIDAFHDVATADAATNAVMSDVIGNKADAASAGAVSEVESIMAYAKQLVGEGISRDAAIAVIDGLLDVPSEDLATDATINQVVGKKSDTVAGTSLVALAKQNAAAIVVVDTVVDETNGYLEAGGDIHDVLYADAAGASIAIDIAANQTDLDAILATNGSADSSGTFSYLDAGAEQDVVELTNSTRKTISAIFVDAINLTNNGTFKVYYKVDGTNYRELVANATTITAGTDEAINLIAGNLAITEDFKVTYTEASDEGAARDIPFSVIYETKE